MKKIIFALSMLLLIISSTELSFAAEGDDLIYQKPVWANEPWNKKTLKLIFTNGTGTNPQAQKVIWGELDNVASISGYHLNATAPYDLTFYNTDREVITTVDMLVGDHDIDQVNYVKYFVMRGKDNTTPTLRQIKLFEGTSKVMEEVRQIQSIPSPTDISLSWLKPNDDDYAKAEIYLNDVLLGSTQSFQYTLSDLTPDTTYKIKIVAIDVYDTRSAGTEFYVTTLDIDKAPPAEIKDLKSYVYNDRIKFTWTNPPDIDFHEVRIYRDGKQIAVAVTPSNQFTDYDLSEHTTYTFVFYSVDTDGNVSAGVGVTETTKGKPRGTVVLKGEAWENLVEISWTTNAEATKYYVYKDGEKYAEVTDTKYTITNLINNTAYEFYVVPLNEWGEGDRSNEIQLTPKEIPIPDKPSTVRYAASNRSITLYWSPVSYAQKYNIYQEDDSGETSFIKSILFDIAYAAGEVKIGETTATSYTIDGLEEGTSYTYYVSAENEKGESPKTSVTTRTTSQPIPVDMSIDLTPWDVIYNAIVLIGSMASLILMALSIYFAPRIIQLIKQAAS